MLFLVPETPGIEQGVAKTSGNMKIYEITILNGSPCRRIFEPSAGAEIAQLGLSPESNVISYKGTYH